MKRLSILLCIFYLALSVTPARAECNQFERIQSIILSEATSQPLPAQIEIARVIVTKGACFLSPDFYSGYAVALASAPTNHHYRAYFALYSFAPYVRETAAQAAHVALTELPKVPRYHFDNKDSQAWWWNSLTACPQGWWIVADIKYC